MKSMVKKGAIFFATGLFLSALLASRLNAAAPNVAGSTSSDLSVAVSVDDGATLFLRNCAVCHGKDGKGLPAWKAKGQPDFTDAKWQKSRSDAQLASSIKNGKGPSMPAFKSRLSDAEITAVVARVRSFGKG